MQVYCHCNVISSAKFYIEQLKSYGVTDGPFELTPKIAIFRLV